MKTDQTKVESVLVMLQCCHSILGTVWPRPGHNSLAGAGRFISTKWFSSLENIDQELRVNFKKHDTENCVKKYENIWEDCHRIIVSLKQLKDHHLDPTIDLAFNFLYLTTGIIYQEIAANFSIPPKQDERFSTVEHLDDLLLICNWRPKSNANLALELNTKLIETANDLAMIKNL